MIKLNWSQRILLQKIQNVGKCMKIIAESILLILQSIKTTFIIYKKKKNDIVYGY